MTTTVRPSDLLSAADLVARAEEASRNLKNPLFE
jgi:hypothetical protein